MVQNAMEAQLAVAESLPSPSLTNAVKVEVEEVTEGKPKDTRVLSCKRQKFKLCSNLIAGSVAARNTFGDESVRSFSAF